MDTNSETKQAAKSIDWIDKMVFIVPAFVVLIFVGSGLWVYFNHTPRTAQEKAESNAATIAMMTTAGEALGVALGASWDTVQDVAEFLAHGRIDSPFSVVVVCLTAAYVARLRTRGGGLPRQRGYTTSHPVQAQSPLATTATQSWVYFIANHEDGAVKIGYSDDPQRRLSELQMGNHSRLEIMATVPGGEETERILHSRFAGCRIDGEWFDLTGELEEFALRLRNGAG